MLDIKPQFPVLNRPHADGKPLVYLDTAATAQKPVAVIDAMDRFYRESYGTVRRGVYRLSEKATAAYEGTRAKAAKLLNAASEKEIVYTRGSTDGLNLVAASYGGSVLKPGDEIVLTQLEHHANIVPWQMVAEKTGAKIKVVPCDDRGVLDLDAYSALLASGKVKIVAVGHVSNALGTIHPIAEMARRAHAAKAVIVVDGAQGISHQAVDVQALGADFYAFSSHKMFGPTGVGILYGRYELLKEMPPYQGGGDMIRRVTFEKTTYQDPPHRFEAGTPSIVEVVGLGAAIDWITGVGIDKIAAHEHALLEYGTPLLAAIPGLRLIGTAPEKAGVLGFVLDGIHPHDIGTLLDQEGIAIRAGHHCAQPAMDRFGVPATARASLGPYNTEADLDALAEGIKKIQRMFA
ncbi:MAG TPA: cysteine desulfurase [Fibrobacteria bacterium]|nr:cysteine desulfurase [Fibrobacteria bacterium]